MVPSKAERYLLINNYLRGKRKAEIKISDFYCNFEI